MTTQTVSGSVQTYDKDGFFVFQLDQGSQSRAINRKSVRLKGLPNPSPDIVYSMEISPCGSVASSCWQVSNVISCYHNPKSKTMAMTPEYYRLQCLFSQHVLNGKTMGERKRLLRKIATNPLSFCFSRDMGCFVSAKRARSFNARDMFWNIDDLVVAAKQGYFKWKELKLPEVSVLRQALTCYHDFCRSAYYQGDTVMSTNEDPALRPAGMQFLLEQGFLCHPCHVNELVTTPAFDAIEAEFAQLLSRAKTYGYSCAFYEGSLFSQKLVPLLSKLDQGGKKLLCASATSLTASYLNELLGDGGDRFLSFSDAIGFLLSEKGKEEQQPANEDSGGAAAATVIPDSKKRKRVAYVSPFRNDCILVLDRANRIGLVQMVKLLSQCNPSEIHVIGDANEGGAPYIRGSDNCIFELVDELEVWAPTSKQQNQQLFATYNAILEGIPNACKYINVEDNTKLISTIVEAAQSHYKGQKYYILAAYPPLVKLAQAQYCNAVLKTEMPGVLMIGHLAFLPEYGIAATISRAILQKNDGREEQVLLKKPIRPFVESYSVYFNELPGRPISTANTTVDPGYVLHAHDFNGPPRPLCFFIVNAQTRRREILAAIKHANKNFVLVLSEGVKFDFLATLPKLEFQHHSCLPLRKNMSTRRFYSDTL